MIKRFLLFSLMSFSCLQASHDKHVVQLTQKTFDSYIKEAKVPVIVDFFAQWCGPCKVMAPRVEEIARKHHDTYLFASVDVDTDESIAEKYSIMSFPTFAIFKDGKLVDTIVGSRTKHSLLKEIENKLEEKTKIITQEKTATQGVTPHE